MIIDVHAHCGRWFFPSFCESPGEVAELCDRYEIAKIVFSSSLAILYDMESGNRHTSQFVAEDERFYGYVYLNPTQPRASDREMERYLQLRKFVGVKLHPSYSGQPANSPATMELLAGLPEDKVALIHTWGPPAVDRVCEVASALPNLTILMGHMGGTGRNDWMAGIRGAESCPNIHLEICGSQLHHDRMAEAVARVGSRRILFGSDLTLISPAFSLGQVLESQISDQEKDQILGGNAARLLHFD